MSVKAMNVKLDEEKLYELKNISSVFHITITDAVNDALDAYLEKMKRNPFYRLTSNIENASDDESSEILQSLSELSDDDLQLVNTEKIEI